MGSSPLHLSAEPLPQPLYQLLGQLGVLLDLLGFQGWNMSLWASWTNSGPRAASTWACHGASRGQTWKRSQLTAVGWEDRAAGAGGSVPPRMFPRGQAGQKNPLHQLREYHQVCQGDLLHCQEGPGSQDLRNPGVAEWVSASPIATPAVWYVGHLVPSSSGGPGSCSILHSRAGRLTLDR